MLWRDWRGQLASSGASAPPPLSRRARHQGAAAELSGSERGRKLFHDGTFRTAFRPDWHQLRATAFGRDARLEESFERHLPVRRQLNKLNTSLEAISTFSSLKKFCSYMYAIRQFYGE